MKIPVTALATELVNAPTVQTITIPDATHYLFKDRPERGRDRFIQEVLTFLMIEESTVNLSKIQRFSRIT